MTINSPFTPLESRRLRVVDHRQIERPDLFITKMRERRRTQADLGTLTNPARNLAAHEVVSAHAAFEFGAAFGVLLDTPVTLDFGRLGKHEPAEVQAALSQFTRCYAAWCNERLITPAYVASVEMGSDHSYHAHLALHVPGDLGNLPMSFRSDFRRWAKGYTERRGGWVPRAIKVRCGRKESLITHWINFHYLVKGYDRKAVLRSGRNSEDGRPIMLGDVMARHYRDPGPVALNRRLSISNSLGPKQREFGAPPLREFMLEQGPNWTVFKVDDYREPTLHEKLFTRWTVPIPKPFRSTMEDGVFDVRRLYSPCFYECVTGLPASGLQPPIRDGQRVDGGDSIQEQIRRVWEKTE